MDVFMLKSNNIDFPDLTDKFVKGEKYNKDNKFIDILSKVAIDVSPVGSAKIAACIVIKNKIISFGINQKKTHPFQYKYSKNSMSIYLHAETDAIRNALKFISVDDMKKATLYVVRVKHNKDNHSKLMFGLSKPCKGCFSAISTFNLKRVVYSTDYGYEEL